MWGLYGADKSQHLSYWLYMSKSLPILCTSTCRSPRLSLVLTNEWSNLYGTPTISQCVGQYGIQSCIPKYGKTRIERITISELQTHELLDMLDLYVVVVNNRLSTIAPFPSKVAQWMMINEASDIRGDFSNIRWVSNTSRMLAQSTNRLTKTSKGN